MAKMTDANFNTAFNITGSPTLDVNSTPAFSVDEQVFWRADATVAASTTAGSQTWERVTVQRYIAYPIIDGGESKFMAKDKVTPATSAGATPDPSGATTGDLTTPHFFDIKRANGDVVRDVHQSQLLDATQMAIYYPAEAANFI